VTQDKKLALECAAKVNLRRISVIWSSPLSDINRVRASINQSALSANLFNVLLEQHIGLNYSITNTHNDKSEN